MDGLTRKRVCSFFSTRQLLRCFRSRTEANSSWGPTSRSRPHMHAPPRTSGMPPSQETAAHSPARSLTPSHFADGADCRAASMRWHLPPSPRACSTAVRPSVRLRWSSHATISWPHHCRWTPLQHMPSLDLRTSCPRSRSRSTPQCSSAKGESGRPGTAHRLMRRRLPKTATRPVDCSIHPTRSWRGSTRGRRSVTCSLTAEAALQQRSRHAPWQSPQPRAARPRAASRARRRSEASAR